MSIGAWFGVPAGIAAWIGCLIYAVAQYGWFIGIPLGVFIGGFFAILAGVLAMLGWPLVAFALFLIVKEMN